MKIGPVVYWIVYSNVLNDAPKGLMHSFMFQMITRLGVSKAVLENVIFCHQEEANWFVFQLCFSERRETLS